MGLCAVLALAFAFFACLVPIAISDFWWQLETGELIVATGAIPRQDPFSWTALGEPWQVHEWLSEVLFYLVYTHLSSWALVAYKCGLGAVACGLVLLRGRARSGSFALGVAAALAAAPVIRNYADLRPQMLSFVLLAALFLALDAYRRGRWKWLPWALPPGFALWANLHGGVIVGALLLVLWVGGEAVHQWWTGDRESPPAFPVGPLALSTLASLFCVALNPNGFSTYVYPFWVLGHPTVMSHVTEWYAPDFHNPAMRAFELLLIATLGAAAVARGRSRLRLGEALVLVAAAHAALSAQRNTAAFALVAAPAVAGCLASFLGESPGLPALRSLARQPWVRTAGAAALAILLGALVVRQLPTTPGGSWIPPGQWFEYGTQARSYFPEAAVRHLEQGGWPGQLYNDYDWGGYLIWNLHPRRGVFIDGRAEVYYGKQVFEDAMTLSDAADGWQAALDRRQVDVVLTRLDGKLAAALSGSPGWKTVFTGPVERVFVRRQEPGAASVREPSAAPSS